MLLNIVFSNHCKTKSCKVSLMFLPQLYVHLSNTNKNDKYFYISLWECRKYFYFGVCGLHCNFGKLQKHQFNSKLNLRMKYIMTVNLFTSIYATAVLYLYNLIDYLLLIIVFVHIQEIVT